LNFARIADLHAPDIEATASLIFVAAVELVCGWGADDLAVLTYAWSAAGFYLFVALVLFCSSMRARRSA